MCARPTLAVGGYFGMVAKALTGAHRANKIQSKLLMIIIGRMRTCASVCPVTVNLPHSLFYDIITPWALRYDNDYYYYVYSDLGALRVRRMNSWKWLRFFFFFFLLSAARDNTASADKSGAFALMVPVARPAAHEFIRRAGCTTVRSP